MIFPNPHHGEVITANTHPQNHPQKNNKITEKKKTTIQGGAPVR